MTALEIVANVCILASVYAARKNSVHVWWIGMIGVTLYAVMFFGAKLYADVVLQGFFFASSVVGWWQWKHGGTGGAELPITMLLARGRILAALAVVGAAMFFGTGFSTFTDAALPYADSYILGGSVVAQLLMMRRKLDHWPIWISVDIVAVVVYSLKALYLTAAVYGVLLLLCVQGLAEWRRIYAAHEAAPTPVAG